MIPVLDLHLASYFSALFDNFDTTRNHYISTSELLDYKNESQFHVAAIIAEKLRRKDLEVARALEEKQRLIAEILNVPLEEFEAAVASGGGMGSNGGGGGGGAADLSSSSSGATPTAAASGSGGGGSSSSSSTLLHPGGGAAAALADKDAREVLLAALAQGSSLKLKQM